MMITVAIVMSVNMPGLDEKVTFCVKTIPRRNADNIGFGYGYEAIEEEEVVQENAILEGEIRDVQLAEVALWRVCAV